MRLRWPTSSRRSTAFKPIWDSMDQEDFSLFWWEPSTSNAWWIFIINKTCPAWFQLSNFGTARTEPSFKALFLQPLFYARVKSMSDWNSFSRASETWTSSRGHSSTIPNSAISPSATCWFVQTALRLTTEFLIQKFILYLLSCGMKRKKTLA